MTGSPTRTKFAVRGLQNHWYWVNHSNKKWSKLLTVIRMCHFYSLYFKNYQKNCCGIRGRWQMFRDTILWKTDKYMEIYLVIFLIMIFRTQKMDSWWMLTNKLILFVTSLLRTPNYSQGTMPLAFRRVDSFCEYLIQVIFHNFMIRNLHNL